MKTIVVGAGISGLATAHALRAMQPGIELRVLEAAGRVGGKVWTEQTPEGFRCEWGVNGFLDNKPKTLELAAALGLEPLRGRAAADRRYVFRHGTLHSLPESPPAFLTSRLMSLPGRLRVLWEVLAPKGRAEDETLAEFAQRRLGREAFEALIDPMASGVFAGDPHRMSLKSCFPRIYELESRYGSLIRGMIRLQIEARRRGGSGPGAGPGGKLTSFADGMGAMTGRLAEQLGARVRLATPVAAIEPAGGRFLVHTESGPAEEAECVVLAAPAFRQAQILQSLDGELADLLRGIEYPPVAVVCLGFAARDVAGRLDGFGFLVPGSEGRRILGTVFDSSVFPGRAPKGSVLLRTLVGGARFAELAQLPDAQLLDAVRGELKDVLGIAGEPMFAQIHRHQHAIPQYHIGHARRLEAIATTLRGHPGLVLTGNAFRGVSLNDCIENAWRVADALIEGWSA